MANISILGDAAADYTSGIIGGLIRAGISPVASLVEGTARVMDALKSDSAGPQASEPSGGEGGDVAWPTGAPAAAGGGAAGVRAGGGGGGGGYPEAPAYPSEGGASVWPWLIGLAVLGGAGYVVYRVVKKKRKH